MGGRGREIGLVWRKVLVRLSAISCVCEVERRRGGGDEVFVEDEVICGHGLFGAGCV
jgi:hypothetical protein